MNGLLSGISRALFDGFDLQRTLSEIEAALRSPGEHREVAILMIAAIAVAVALLILFLLMLVTPSKKKVLVTRTYAPGGHPEGPSTPPDGAPPSKPPSRVFLALTGPVAVAGLVVGGLVGLYAATSTDYYCAQTCHAGAESIEAAVEMSHSGCRGCHEARLVLGAPVNVVSRFEMVWASLRSVDAGVAKEPADSAPCARCHSGDIEGTLVTAAGLAVSHQEVLDAAVPCTECHARAGHEEPPAPISMSKCIGCHDSSTASAECSTCHREDPIAAGFVQESGGKIVGSGFYQYPAVRAANRRCGVCHDLVASCDGCHGIRMPHSAEFKEGGHAVAAAFERKLLCGNCHDPVECGGCHTGFNATDGRSAHAGDWKSGHRSARWDAGCGCHTGRSARDYPICFRCHDRDHGLKPIEP